jgi:hypothetical protein
MGRSYWLMATLLPQLTISRPSTREGPISLTQTSRNRYKCVYPLHTNSIKM